MMFMRFVKPVLLLVVLMGLSACALDRSTVAIEPPASISNPAMGVDVKLVNVLDERIFEYKPATPDIPSLSENEINNADVKARAFARKRNSYGQAHGDVVLPAGETTSP